jgi:AMP nucleosidase
LYQVIFLAIPQVLNQALGIANTFYRQRVNQHLEIGLEAIRLLREGESEQLHSRKLRGFDEPPFR